MGLQAQQIVSLACQIAKCPGFVQQAGQLLNSILQELAQSYDLDILRKTTTFNFNTVAGGYNTLPADFLRVRQNDFFYTISGVPYVMVSIELADFDALPQTAGFNSFPTQYAVDMAASPPNAYFYPPPNGAYPVTLRYQSLPADITTPETSTAIPWFPQTNYLITRLAGELMRITDDDRASAFLGDNEDATPQGAGVLLRKYLEMKDDPEGRVKRVELDRRLFGPSSDRLRNTKLVGW